MFLSKKYILGNELVQKMKIHIANISMFAKNMEDQNDYSTCIKMNNCTFINTESHKIPNNLKKGILEHEFTDLSDKMLCSYVKTEYELNENELRKANIIKDKIKIAGKKFYVFNDWFVEKMTGMIAYILDKDETNQCIENGDILGFIKINNNKYLTYYKDFTR